MENKLYILVPPEKFEEISHLQPIYGIDIDSGKFVAKISCNDDCILPEGIDKLGSDLDMVTEMIKILRTQKNELELLEIE